MKNLGRLTAIPACLAGLLIAGCGGVGQGDQTACDLVANASSAVAEAVVNREQAADADKDLYRELVKSADAAVAGQIEIAIDKAEDADLIAELARLLDYKTLANAGSDDAGVAYFLQLTTVESQCSTVGASSEFKDFEDFE